MKPAIDIHALNFSYGSVPTLSGIELQVAEGEFLGIVGPNAGGKTVVLKTIGLISLMLAAGLPIPVDPDSYMGIPKNVLSDIGDDQSLEKNLSTFSAHMSNIASILEGAEEGSVVLLDELDAAGAGTVELLDRVAREPDGPPVQIVAALRPGQIEQPTLRKLYADTVTHEFTTHQAQWKWALANLPMETDWVLGLDADQVHLIVKHGYGNAELCSKTVSQFRVIPVD